VVLAAANGGRSRVEFATLSSLHGIVPDAFAASLEATHYDLNLNRYASLRDAGITPAEARARIVDLASRFLHRYGRSYRGVVGYGRENYQRVFKQLQCSHFPRLVVLPADGSRLSGGGLDELRDAVRDFLQRDIRMAKE